MEVEVDNEKKAYNIRKVYCYQTFCFRFSFFFLRVKSLFELHASQTPKCCHPSNHHTREARLYLIYKSYKQYIAVGLKEV